MTARVRARSGRPSRVNDPEGVRRNIIEEATREFAQKGYGGARVDAIAARTRTSKRMIYYYFGSKEGLYLAVLEEAYSAIRRTEAPSWPWAASDLSVASTRLSRRASGCSRRYLRTVSGIAFP